MAPFQPGGSPYHALRVNDLLKVTSYLLSGLEENAQEPSLFDCFVPEFALGTSPEGYALSFENPALGPCFHLSFQHEMTLKLDGEATAFFLYSLQVSMAMFGAKIEVQAHVPVVCDCG